MANRQAGSRIGLISLQFLSRKYLTIVTTPKKIAGNRIATTIGGRAPVGATAKGTRVKNSAATQVIAAH
jgi:hypothetical protein